MNMAAVLERAGARVLYDPAQTCCGQPAFNTGYHDEARRMAMHFLDVFRDAEYVVAPSGSCIAMVKVFYGDLLQLPEKYRRDAELLRPRLWEFTSFLVDVLGCDDVGAVFPARVTLHDCCHALRELHIAAQPRALLANVRGLELVELENSRVCCGFGGTFAVKHAALSTAIGLEKIDEIVRVGVDCVTAVDSSCLMQIEGLLRRRGSDTRALHIADILASGG